MSSVIANGKPVEAKLPCSLEAFLVAQKLLPRSVVVEHNGEAVAPEGGTPNGQASFIKNNVKLR